MKRLALKKERLAELTTDELARVAGAAPPTIDCVRDPSLLRNCASELFTCTTAMSCGGGCESRDVCN